MPLVWTEESAWNEGMVLAWVEVGLKVDADGMGLERRGGEPPSEFLAHDDGGQVQDQDQGDEK